MKVLCYSVNSVEKPYFDNFSKKYNLDITCTDRFLTNDESARLAQGYDAVILRANCDASRENLDIYKECGVKYLLTRTVGVNHIDLDYANKLGFKMASVPVTSPHGVAELVVTHALMLLTNNKTFKSIKDLTVGVIGLGHVGSTTAKLFQGLGATVIGHDIKYIDSLRPDIDQVSLDELLSQSDIISLHCPYSRGDEKIITSDFLNKIEPGTILINSSRGELHDVPALIEALESGRLGGLGVDVLENEVSVFFKDFQDGKLPDSNLEKLINMYPKVLISPHIGSFTDEAITNMIETSFQNLLEFEETNDCKNRILLQPRL